MTINRNKLLSRIIRAKHDGFVKLITGIRRCGKSFLLFNLFKNHLLEDGVAPDHIIEVDLESGINEPLRRPDRLGDYLRSKVIKDGKWNYILIDEIQLCKSYLPEHIDLARVHPDDRKDCYVKFYGVLSEFKKMPFVDVYVTGSSSRMLESDVATEFRGRGEVIRVTPLSFAEFHAWRSPQTDSHRTLLEYLTYGGLPECVMMQDDADKREYLSGLFRSIYLKDLLEKRRLGDDMILDAIVNAVMSNIGCLTNPTRIANHLQTAIGTKYHRNTIVKYLDYLTDAFLISKAARFDVRGNHHLDYPYKYYAADTGLRNARLNFRQVEYTHLMENVIYNELLRNGYSVDVGTLQRETTTNGKHVRTSHEIDFVVNRGYERIYIQSAWMIPDEEKMAQETFSLKHTGDNFKKVVIDGQYSTTYRDNDGIGHIGLVDFLLDPHSLETL